MSGLRCWRCFHEETDLGPRGICTKEIVPATGPRLCACPLLVIGPPRNGVCRSCGSGVVWWRTRHGKPVPCDPDGVNHFATCPSADLHRKRQRLSFRPGNEKAASSIPTEEAARSVEGL